MSEEQATPVEQTESRVAQIEAQLVTDFLQTIQPQQGEKQDPLVDIRQKELAIRAAESERRAQLDASNLQLEREKLQQRAATDSARLELQEDIADQRAEVNLTRIQAQQNRN